MKRDVDKLKQETERKKKPGMKLISDLQKENAKLKEETEKLRHDNEKKELDLKKSKLETKEIRIDFKIYKMKMNEKLRAVEGKLIDSEKSRQTIGDSMTQAAKALQKLKHHESPSSVKNGPDMRRQG